MGTRPDVETTTKAADTTTKADTTTVAPAPGLIDSFDDPFYFFYT
jgi:hypothetical protein